MRSLGLSFAVLLLSAALPAGAGESGAKAAPEAMQVLTAAIRSMGGESALADIPAISFASSGVYTTGEMKSPYTSTVLYVLPGSLRWDMKSEAFSGSMAISGKECWSAFMQPPARCRGAMAESMAAWILQQEIFLAKPLLDHAGAIVDLKAKAGGKTTLALTLETGKSYELVYAETGEKTWLVATSGPMTMFDGKEGRFEMEYSDPKLFGFITLPAKSVMRMYGADGKLSESMEETITSVTLNPEVEKDAFDLPRTSFTIGKPAVEDVPEMTGVVLLHEGAYETIDQTMGRLLAIAADKGLVPAGPIVTIYLNDPGAVKDPSELRTEIVFPFVPMGPPPELPAGAALRTYPAFKAATVNLKGEYGTQESEKIPALFAWMEKNGHTPGGPPRVCYHHHPAFTVPEDQLSTIQIPIAK